MARDAALRVIARGAPIAMKGLDPVPVAPLYGCVIKQGKNPNAARLLLSWLNTKVGGLTYEQATDRGNFLIAETETAQFLKGTKVTYFTARQSIEQEKSLNALERDLALVLRRR